MDGLVDEAVGHAGIARQQTREAPVARRPKLVCLAL
jgi:hypothetical protein